MNHVGFAGILCRRAIEVQVIAHASMAPVERGILVRMASSFWDLSSRHVGRIDGLLYLMHRLVKEKASRMGLPNTTCAGDILQSGSGVLRAWSNARRRPSLFRDPVGPTVSISMRFCLFDRHFCTTVLLGEIRRGHAMTGFPSG